MCLFNADVCGAGLAHGRENVPASHVRGYGSEAQRTQLLCVRVDDVRRDGENVRGKAHHEHVYGREFPAELTICLLP